MAEGEEKKFVDNYDILRFLGVVHTKIKKEIKEDFVLAKITDERRKEGFTLRTKGLRNATLLNYA